MNGLCPACRRPYNDENIIYKPITPDEQAAYKARQAQKQKKTQAALQKEKQKAEADNLSRKHLAGLRVVQKNLVYVTGLSPNFQEDKLLQTLRGDEYFGQYGKIIKIVVSKAKDTSYPQSVGVYVTYERKEDAATCISMVNGAKNGDRTLRAQFGTTKYCSAYLRGENCSNRQCMFLHEPGEANESYSRADLSALNAGSSQHGPGRPPPQSQQPVASASASQPMARQPSSDRAESPALERPALPSTASWASRPSHTLPVRSESRSTSGTVESPALVHAIPAQPPAEQTQESPPAAPSVPVSDNATQTATQPQRPRRPREVSPLLTLLKNFNVDDLKFAFSASSLSQTDKDVIDNYPPLFDKNGGARRRLRKQKEEEQNRIEEAAQAFQQPPSLDHEESTEMGGSLQLGGEPEDRATLSQPQSAIQPPGSEGLLDQRFQFGGISSPGLDGRGLTPQQQQQLLLMKGQGGSYLNSNQPSSFQQPSHPPGHQRNASRYSFANESSASTSVKPVANAKLLSQQSSIMPPTGSNHFGAQQQSHGGQFYTSNVQGPPPGLRTTGTPPVSGGMTFGQGHGFATGGLQYGANATGRNANEEMMRNLLRTRGDAGGDASSSSKREFNSFSNFTHNSNSAFPTAGGNQQGFPPGPPSAYSHSSFSGEEKQRKKKSKKHRHANTSSSSGAGLGDAGVDGHLLQARFAQGGGGAFGGQAAGAGGGIYGVMHGGGGSGYGGRW
jgi:CCR4-NOT transcription complex subunit 4